MAISNPVSRKDVVFIQRDNINSAYGEIHVSGSLLIPYIDADGNLTVADSASFFTTFPASSSSGGPSTSASWADFAKSASFALTSHLADTASYFSGVSESASFASRTISSSHALNANLADTASYVSNAATSTSASFATRTISASHALRSNQADTASYVSTVNSASHALFSDSSSYSDFSKSSSFANTSSWAISASWAPGDGSGTTLNTGSTYQITASAAETASVAASASVSISASFASNAHLSDTASYVSTVGSASHAGFSNSASYADFSKSGSYSQTASWAISASWAPGGTGTSESSSWASASLSSSWADFARSASYSQTASIAISASWAPATPSDVTVSASWASASLSSSYAQTSSWAGQSNTSSVVSNIQSYVWPFGDTVRVVAGETLSFVFGDVGSTYNVSHLPISASLITASHILASAITSSLFGTASWAISASWAPATPSDVAVSASWASASLSSSWADFAHSASWAPSTPSSVSVSSSWASASLSSSWADTASWAISASTAYTAVSASWAEHSFTPSETSDYIGLMMENFGDYPVGAVSSFNKGVGWLNTGSSVNCSIVLTTGSRGIEKKLYLTSGSRYVRPFSFGGQWSKIFIGMLYTLNMTMSFTESRNNAGSDYHVGGFGTCVNSLSHGQSELSNFIGVTHRIDTVLGRLCAQTSGQNMYGVSSSYTTWPLVKTVEKTGSANFIVNSDAGGGSAILSLNMSGSNQLHGRTFWGLTITRPITGKGTYTIVTQNPSLAANVLTNPEFVGLRSIATTAVGATTPQWTQYANQSGTGTVTWDESGSFNDAVQLFWNGDTSASTYGTSSILVDSIVVSKMI